MSLLDLSLGVEVCDVEIRLAGYRADRGHEGLTLTLSKSD